MHRDSASLNNRKTDPSTLRVSPRTDALDFCRKKPLRWMILTCGNQRTLGGQWADGIKTARCYICRESTGSRRISRISISIPQNWGERRWRGIMDRTRFRVSKDITTCIADARRGEGLAAPDPLDGHTWMVSNVW